MGKIFDCCCVVRSLSTHLCNFTSGHKIHDTHKFPQVSPPGPVRCPVYRDRSLSDPPKKNGPGWCHLLDPPKKTGPVVSFVPCSENPRSGTVSFVSNRSTETGDRDQRERPGFGFQCGGARQSPMPSFEVSKERS
jgi:hypothetical protein